MSRALFASYDRVTKSMTRVTTDPTTGCTLIVRSQDYAPIVAANRRLAARFDKHQARALAVKSGGGRLVAQIPIVEFMQLQRLGITRNTREFRLWMSRRDTRHFRVDDGSKLA
jgi:hypothetical protein